MNTDRRVRRSSDKWHALTHLCEAVRERSDVSAVAIVDASGSVLTGVGTAAELALLEQTASPAASGTWARDLDERTRGTDVLARGFDARGMRFYLAALGTRVRAMPEATRAVQRILTA